MYFGVKEQSRFFPPGPPHYSPHAPPRRGPVPPPPLLGRSSTTPPYGEVPYRHPYRGVLYTQKYNFTGESGTPPTKMGSRTPPYGEGVP